MGWEPFETTCKAKKQTHQILPGPSALTEQPQPHSQIPGPGLRAAAVGTHPFVQGSFLWVGPYYRRRKQG